jgi:predicted NodU family carbamoyl transferase
MQILGIKEGHDGAYAIVSGEHLDLCIEAEKDSYPRCTNTTADALLRACVGFDPDVIAVGGWTKGLFSSESPTFTGYFGIGSRHESLTDIDVFGRQRRLFSSTHEAGHIWCAYALSPLPQGTPCYVLIWEGNVGNFYFIDEKLSVTDLGTVLTDPGNRYTFAFSLADTSSPSKVGFYDTSHPGKMMALAAYGSPGEMTDDEAATWDFLKNAPQFQLMNQLAKDDLRWSSIWNCGVESDKFKTFARKLTDKLFETFLSFAREHCNRGLPLLIAGGCGLNCEWNSKWKDCGLFPTVFVPPCCNDSGSAIGAAAHAKFRLTGNAKLDWSVYCGEAFVHDTEIVDSHFTRISLSSSDLAQRLYDGAIIAWVEGRYEIGPRALGHRSLLASPKERIILTRLNEIKQREAYRPIAPICTQEGLRNFKPQYANPHMLFFYEVTNAELPAVTHVDGSARVQTLAQKDAPLLHDLLIAFGAISGDEVLCNTSLNFKGKGFINRTSDLLEYSRTRGLDGFVIDGAVYWRNN